MEKSVKKIVKICQQQIGFMREKHTTDALFCLKNAIRKILSRPVSASLLVYSFEKASDVMLKKNIGTT